MLRYSHIDRVFKRSGYVTILPRQLHTFLGSLLVGRSHLDANGTFHLCYAVFFGAFLNLYFSPNFELVDLKSQSALEVEEGR